MDFAANRFDKDSYYERITRLTRWLVVLIVVVSFPSDHPKAFLVDLMLAIACLYNLTRYLPILMNSRIWSSATGAIVVDNVLVGGFLYLIGNISTPYSIFLILISVGALFRRGLWGLVGTLAFQTLVITGILFHPSSDMVTLGRVPTALAAICGLFTLGFLVERLTHGERDEEQGLLELSNSMRTERERLLVLINNLTEAAFVIDQNGQILFYNAGALALLNTNTELQGHNLNKLLPLQNNREEPTEIIKLAQLAEASSRHRTDLTYQGSDGQTIRLDLNIAPVRVADHRHTMLNYVVLCRDITKEKSLDQQRDEFIAVASHELRTPLAITEAALSGALLPQMKASPQLKQLIDQAHRNVVFLAGLVQDLTTIAEAHNDAIQIELKRIDAHTLLQQLAEDYQAQADAKHLKLSVMVAPNTPPVLATERHIHEILQNYLVNAFKYTHQGSVELRAETGDTGGVRFSVRDTGIGISASDQPHLFSRFYRSEDYRTRETGGTGLGLYLCRELAQRMNGRVWVESTLNEGSTFYLEVPPVSQLQRDSSEVVKAEVSDIVSEL